MAAPPPPKLTYISKQISDDRTNWYLKHKRPILDQIVGKYNGSRREREYFYYSDPRVISNLFGYVLQNENYTGLRIYLGSCLDTIPTGCDLGDKGKLVLIYVPTVEKDGNVKTDNESGEYFKLRMGNCTRVKLSKKVAKELVSNYQNEKKPALSSSLSAGDLASTATSEETKHLFIDKEKLEEIKREIDYQLHMSAQYGVSGIKVCINSYTNQPFKKSTQGPELRQRLTVQFVFTDDAGQDLDLVGIDPRYNVFKAGFVGAQNTIDPTPPYPPPKSSLDL
jgi:hypothetical protein